MKTIRIIFGIVILGIIVFLGISGAQAAVQIPGGNEVQDVSVNLENHASGDVVGSIVNVGLYVVFPIIKQILMAVLVIFIVYAGAMMIMSIGSDEEQLSSGKRQIWYALVALVFINIPGALFNAFRQDPGAQIGGNVEGSFTSDPNDSILFNFLDFGITVNNQIVFFLEIMIFLGAIVMLTLAGVQVMTSRGREEKMKEAKNKFVYTILALVFVSFIEAWKNVAFGGVIDDGVDLFEALANLALFFAAPVAIFFLTLAGYYYITDAGDEERVKKAKSIIINTLLATIILLAAYTFLLDLATL